MGKQKIERRSVRVDDGANGPHLITLDLPARTLILGGEVWARLHGGLDIQLDLGIEVDAPAFQHKLLIAGEGDELPDLDGSFSCQLRAHSVNGEEDVAYLFTIEEEGPSNG